MEEGKEDNVPTKRALFRRVKKHYATGQHKKVMLTINGIRMTTNTNALNKGLTQQNIDEMVVLFKDC